MRAIARSLSGVLICLSFWPHILESQTVCTPETPAEASAKQEQPAGMGLSSLGNLPLQFEENEGQAVQKSTIPGQGKRGLHATVAFGRIGPEPLAQAE